MTGSSRSPSTPFPMVWRQGELRRVSGRDMDQPWTHQRVAQTVTDLHRIAVVTVPFPYAPSPTEVMRPTGNAVLEAIPAEIRDQVEAFALNGAFAGVGNPFIAQVRYRHFAEVALYGRPQPAEPVEGPRRGLEIIYPFQFRGMIHRSLLDAHSAEAKVTSSLLHAAGEDYAVEAARLVEYLKPRGWKFDWAVGSTWGALGGIVATRRGTLDDLTLDFQEAGEAVGRIIATKTTAEFDGRKTTLALVPGFKELVAPQPALLTL